jgi:hypothetical protein
MRRLSLNRSRIGSLVSERIAAGEAQHMRAAFSSRQMAYRPDKWRPLPDGMSTTRLQRSSASGGFGNT